MAHTRRGFLARIGAAVIGLTLASKLPGMAKTGRKFLPARVYDIGIDDYHYGVIEVGTRVPFGVETVRNPRHAAWATKSHAVEFLWRADGRKYWKGQSVQRTFAAYYP